MRGIFWVKALAAADFESAAVRPSRNTSDAAVATAADVCLRGLPACASALPAADFDLLPVDGLDNVFEALVAADADVTSFLATWISRNRNAWPQ